MTTQDVPHPYMPEPIPDPKLAAKAIEQAHGMPDDWLQYTLRHAQNVAALRESLSASTRIAERLVAVRDKQDTKIAELEKKLAKLQTAASNLLEEISWLDASTTPSLLRDAVALLGELV
jgi:hypothetical protein